ITNPRSASKGGEIVMCNVLLGSLLLAGAGLFQRASGLPEAQVMQEAKASLARLVQPIRGAPQEIPSKVVREEIRGGVAFSPENRKWIRITGKVKVLDAHTLLYEGGTEVDLQGGIDAPDLEQKGLIGGSFYPCGKEAAAFLSKLIGDRSVTCYANPEHVK